MFSIFTSEAFELAKKFSFNRYKIASRTLIDNFDLAKKIVAEKKKLLFHLDFGKKMNYLSKMTTTLKNYGVNQNIQHPHGT